MHRSLPFAFVLLLALIAGGVWWFSHDSAPVTPTTPPGPSAAATQPSTQTGSAIEPATSDADPVTSKRSAAEATSGNDTVDGRSILRVRAQWQDESPATDIMISLGGTSRSQGYRIRGQRLTDAGGLAIFTDVPPGKWSVRSDRGDRESVEFAGGEQDFVFRLKAGVAVHGTVISADDRPVAGASVWLQTRGTDWSAGRIVTASDANGQFALDRIPPDLSLGAFAAGHTASPLVDLDVIDTSTPPAQVRLQLGPVGGQLIGTVLDTGGKAIAGARVAVGEGPRHLEMRGDRIIEQWSCRSVASDENGRFIFDGLTPGPLSVAARSPGHGIARHACLITAGETTELRIEMAPAGTIRGVVTDGAGEPMPGAVLSCYDEKPRTPFIAGGQIDFDKTFGPIRAEARSDGTFVLEDVTAGTAFVFAQPGGRIKWGEPVPYASDELAVTPGNEVEWNPVVSDGRSIEGIVYYRDGHVMPNVFITITDENSNQQHVQTNNDKGVFRFVNLDASTYGISVQYWDAPKGTPPLQQANVVPNQGRVELHAPFDKPVKKAKGTVSGSIDDAGARITNIKNARVVLMSEARWFRENGEIVNGAFEFTRVEPCRFRLALVEGETVLAQSDWFELQPGATLDTGALRTVPGGSLHITLTRPAGTEELKLKLHLRQGSLWRSTQVEMGRDQERTVGNLTPGDYQVSGYARGMVGLKGQITITAGNTAELQLELQPGVRCKIEVWFPVGNVAGSYKYTITDKSTGAPFFVGQGELASAPTRPFPVIRTMPRGQWSIEFVAGELSGRSDFVVDGSTDEVQVRLDLAVK